MEACSEPAGWINSQHDNIETPDQKKPLCLTVNQCPDEQAPCQQHKIEQGFFILCLLNVDSPLRPWLEQTHLRHLIINHRSARRSIHTPRCSPNRSSHHSLLPHLTSLPPSPTLFLPHGYLLIAVSGYGSSVTVSYS